MKPATKIAMQVGITANIIEWYGFCIYGYLAKIIGILFFEEKSTIVTIIFSFSIFAISYLSRPLGGLFFGYIGDHYGRAVSLRMATLIMIIPTVLIGIMPTYNQIGIFATSLLIALRLIQGFAAGGELPSSACYIYEISDIKYRNLLCSSVNISSMSGVLLGSMVVTILSLIYNENEILAGAWRIPFLLSIPLMYWILNIRKKIHEQPSFTNEVKENKKIYSNKMFYLSVLKAFTITSYLQACFYLLYVWMPTYLEYFLKVPSNITHLINTTTLIFLVGFTFLASYFSKFLGEEKMMALGIISTTIFIYPLFLYITSWRLQYNNLLIAQLVFALLVSSMSGIIMKFLADLSTKTTRNIGMNVSFAFATSIFGGSAPAVCSYFVSYTGLLTFPAFYIIFLGIIAFLSVCLV